jgi:glycosyltransferase involved in cell wall biosynthesis
MISIVTGTLNRLHLLPNLIENTVNSNKLLELVLVDGGSIDGTIDYIKKLNHPRIKFIEIGNRSSYPHFMNIGIENSTYEWVCQWNDDVLLSNDWNEIICELSDDCDFYLFNWKYGVKDDLKNELWLSGGDVADANGGFCLVDAYETHEIIIMNYGIYNKKIFREIGMYNDEYQYYFADSDMSLRSHLFGYKHKTLINVKVCSLKHESKTAFFTPDSENIYNNFHTQYKNKVLSNKIRKLTL